MDAGHDRFDELAVGHVLGGLDPVDASEFRSHLVGCRSCRMRVAELRDLASELAAAEREERASAQLKTEVREVSVDGEDDAETTTQPMPRYVPILAGLAALVLAAGFWVFQVRDRNETLLAATEQRETTLAMLAEAETVESDLATGVSGIVVADDTDVAFTLAGFPTVVPEGQVVALWLLGVGGGSQLVETIAGEIEDGRLALHRPHDDAEALVVTVQPVGSLRAPAGRELVRAPLTPETGNGAAGGS